MDPNATYAILRYHVDLLIKQLDECDETVRYSADGNELGDTADTVAEAFDALDGWIKKGGALPKPWTVEDVEAAE